MLMSRFLYLSFFLCNFQVACMQRGSQASTKNETGAVSDSRIVFSADFISRIEQLRRSELSFEAVQSDLLQLLLTEERLSALPPETLGKIRDALLDGRSIQSEADVLINKVLKTGMDSKGPSQKDRIVRASLSKADSASLGDWLPIQEGMLAPGVEFSRGFSIGFAGLECIKTLGKEIECSAYIDRSRANADDENKLSIVFSGVVATQLADIMPQTTLQEAGMELQKGFSTLTSTPGVSVWCEQVSKSDPVDCGIQINKK